MAQTFSGTHEDSTTYYLYADYGYDSQRVIAKSSNFTEMRDIFDSETLDPTDMACSVSIEIASFAPSGEYVVHACQAREEAMDGHEI